MAACYGQPQYSTMTEGRPNQWADKQAPEHCPITVLMHCLQQRMPSHKNVKTAHIQVQL